MTWRRQSNLTRSLIKCTLGLQATNIIITGAAGGCNGIKINETDGYLLGANINTRND